MDRPSRDPFRAFPDTNTAPLESLGPLCRGRVRTRTSIRSPLPLFALLLAVACLAGCGEAPAPSSSGSVASPSAESAPSAPVATPDLHPRELLDATRRAIPGGQVVLADDPAFASAEGFGDVAKNDGAWLLERWTVGPRQVLEWAGPADPGAYDVKVFLWRPHPFPEETVEVKYRLPGDAAPRSGPFGVNAVELSGRVETTRAGEPLRIEIEAPTFVPAEAIPGSNDPRALGMIFSHIEVHPAATP